MRLFLYLLLGHLVGDFVLQSSELVRLKRVKLYGVYPHVLLVALATAATVWGSTPYAWLIVAFVAALHLVLDRLSILASAHSSVRQVYIFVADQVLHVAVLALLAYAFTGVGGLPVGPSVLLPLSLWTLALLCGLIAVSFGGGIFVFETAEAVVPSDPEAAEGALLGYSLARVVGMIERGALYLSAVYGLWGVVVALLAARFVWVVTRPADERTRTLAESAATVIVFVIVFGVTLALKETLLAGG